MSSLFLSKYSVKEDINCRLNFIHDIDTSEFKLEHWGQRKLLCIETIFCVYANAREGDILLYVGAASGQHIVFLAQLFSSLTIHLYDSEPFCKSIREFAKQHPNRLKIYDRYFTNADAQLYHTNYNPEQILFVSDIRSSMIDTDHASLDARESYIAKEMNFQKEWALIIQPRCACFKFRLRFNQTPDVYTEYFDGHVIYQPWSRLESAELRLFTDCKQMRLYNDLEYEEYMCYHNVIRRNEPLDHLHPSLYPYFDVEMEFDIWHQYLTMYQQVTNITIDQIFQLMYKATNRLTNYVDRQAKHFRNVFLKSHWIPTISSTPSSTSSSSSTILSTAFSSSSSTTILSTTSSKNTNVRQHPSQTHVDHDGFILIQRKQKNKRNSK